jgi:MFS family permease
MSTAIPQITNDLKSIQDIGWYGSAYQLASCSVQLLFSRTYAHFDHKTLFLLSMGLFEVGSVLSATASKSIALIIGRVVAGLGSAGVMAGAIAIMIPLVPLQKRVIYQSIFASVFAISPVIGPLIGGAFTNDETLTWRWCFYLNLPVGAICAITLFFQNLQPAERSGRKNFTIMCLDPFGTLAFVPCIICLLLALQWGGTTYAWSNPRIIVLLLLFGILLTIWLFIQSFSKEPHVTVPPRLLLQRSIAVGLAFTIFFGGVMLSFHYYVAIWLQAVRDCNPLESGIRTLPFVGAFVCTSILGGAGVAKLGYYVPFAIASSCCMSVAMGLITTLEIKSTDGYMFGLFAFLGCGMGLGAQVSSVAAQTVLAAPDVSMGTSLMIFGQNLGSAIFLSVSQNVFLNELAKKSSGFMSGIDSQVLSGGTNLHQIVPPQYLPAILSLYNDAVMTTFYVPLGIACASIIPALLFERKSIKNKERKENHL